MIKDYDIEIYLRYNIFKFISPQIASPRLLRLYNLPQTEVWGLTQ